MTMSGVFRAAAISLFVVACGGGGGSSTGPNTNTTANNGGNNGNTDNNTVTVSNNVFSPASRTVATGATVDWTWNSCTPGGAYGDAVCIDHSVTFDDGVTSDIQSEGTFSRTFTKAGTYKYHCKNHGIAMSGTITVQ